MRLPRGFSLVEVLLAGSLFALLVTALVGAILYGQESTATAGARGRAVALAEEGLEATRNIRDADFGLLVNGTYGLAISGNQWVFSGTSDVTDIFTRAIAVTTPATNRRQVTSNVTWQATPQRTGAVSLVTYLTAWRASAGAPTTCAAFCQSLGIFSSGQCRADSVACTTNGEVYQSGGDQYCPGAPAVDTCCCAP